MPSWEDIVNQVVIPGDPGRIRDAAATWSVVFAGIASTRDTLQAGLRGLDGWEGEAADAYRAHITGLCTQLDDLHQHYGSVQHLLESAAGSLETAIADIEIPAEMAHFVDQAKQGFLNHKGLSGLGPDALYNMAGPIYNNRMASVMSTLTPDAVQNGISKLRDAFSDDADKAKAVYRKLNNEYGNVHASLPQPTTTPPTNFQGGDELDPTQLGNQSSSSGPSLHGGTSTPTSLTAAPTLATGLGSTSSDDPDLWDSGANDWDPTETGLAGVDGGGLGGLGGSGSALGGLGSGSSLGGLGAGTGSGPGSVLGSPTARPGGISLGAGAGRAGAAGPGRGGMGAPGTGGSGAGGDRPERRTWLTEADDIWGDDSEQLLPGVLGRVEHPEPEPVTESEPAPERAAE